MLALDFAFLTPAVVSSYVLKGFVFSLQLTFIAMLGGIALGTVLALMRLSSKSWLIAAGRRLREHHAQHPAGDGDPLVLPAHPAGSIGRPLGAEYVGHHHLHPVRGGVLLSEIMRAGIQSIPRGQVFAGQALGMTYAQNMRLVVLPQAFRNMLPVLLTQTIILFQDTSLVYAIGAYDLLKGFEVAGKNFNRPVETYLVAAVLYFSISFSLSMLVRKLQQRIAIVR
jgi:glutamate/aspartate transport system permease protein